MIWDGYNRFINPSPEALEFLNRMVALGKPMEPIVTDADRKLAAERLSVMLPLPIVMGGK